MANLKSISTEAEPDTISIDGVQYPLADAGSFSTLEASIMRRRGKLISDRAARDDLSEAEAQEADEALDAIFTMIAPAIPAPVAAKLNMGQKVQIIEAFSSRREELAAPGMADSTPASLPSSGGSSVSTAAA